MVATNRNKFKSIADASNSGVQLRIFSDGEVGVPWRWHGLGIIRINFDPWSGKELFCTRDIDIIEDIKYGLKTEKALYNKLQYSCYLYNYNLLKEKFIDFINKFGNPETTTDCKWWNAKIKNYRIHHAINGICLPLSNYLKGGDDEGMTSIIHVPNIRTYAILNKKEYGGFEPMDYCPFCGAELPSRLDDKLSEILQNEYGLKSWKDYKKAPHEFHTNEWWIKRGL